MNQKRRKTLQVLIDRINDLKEEVEAVQNEEQEAFDNRPANFQMSSEGERCEEIISQIEDAVNDLSTAVESLTDSIQE